MQVDLYLKTTVIDNLLSVKVKEKTKASFAETVK